MQKLFKVIVWAMPLLFLWLLICYATYPLTHADYVVDFNAMLIRANNAFDTTLVSWWNEVSSSLSSDFYNATRSWETFAKSLSVGGWWNQVLAFVESIFNCLKFAFAGVGKILFYYPFTFLYYFFTFLGNVFQILFNPSFVNIGQSYKDEWGY